VQSSKSASTLFFAFHVENGRSTIL
jgi:hypothetical protein